MINTQFYTGLISWFYKDIYWISDVPRVILDIKSIGSSDVNPRPQSLAGFAKGISYHAFSG